MTRRRADGTPRLETRREQFFECVFAADRSEYRFHLRAWTPEAAAQALRSQLGENGVALPGELRVVDARGRTLATLAYEPPPAEGPGSPHR